MTDLARLGPVLREEFAPFNFRVLLSGAACGLIPKFAFSRTRTALMRRCGWQIGKRSLMYSLPRLSGSGQVLDRLLIGEDVMINIDCHFELSDKITIEDGVSLGHEVLLLTSSHRVGSRARRAGASTASPITIGAGAWVGSRTVVLPGVTIGAGAIVSAGSTVSRDVPPNTVVAGIPAAVVVKRLPG